MVELKSKNERGEPASNRLELNEIQQADNEAVKLIECDVKILPKTVELIMRNVLYYKRSESYLNGNDSASSILCQELVGREFRPRKRMPTELIFP